ncbi:HEPN domain-containing protein [Filimonas effusa]|uniref:HEPN domain-containing protein n=1 Tax=Filimonas effusa TaxID=2508721 RepID=A0A4Q1D6S9_9BACT|nr:HEPN domain-containing protein [Filimonas effusa]RXK83431.1 HEPN domain-containing protein [Filimonas effusa]
MKRHLPEHQKVIANAIARAAGICKVYLLGVATELQSYSIFSHWAYTDINYKPGFNPNACFVFVLIDAEGPRSIHVVREKIERLSLHNVTIIPWVMSRIKFRQLLNSGDYFANCVHNNSLLWHDAMPEALINNEEQTNRSDTHLKPIHEEAIAFAQRAYSFMAGVELYMGRKEYALAALLLHQSAEQLFTALIFAQTGYRPQSHNLERLYQYARFICPALAVVQHETPEFIPQLLQLTKAYLESRYGSCQVTQFTLQAVAGRLYQLHLTVTGTASIVHNAA